MIEDVSPKFRLSVNAPAQTHSFKTLLKSYRTLIREKIASLLMVSMAGGYFIGQKLEAPFDGIRFWETFFGLLFLAGGSSALNQIQEREIDAQMPRTRNRPIPSGQVSVRQASIFVALSMSLGLSLLYRANPSTVGLGVLAFVLYNGLYTLWWKKHWAFAAVPGAIPGAIPILVGFVAANGSIASPGGWYLFFILFFWQMPHFWTLALHYKEDYRLGKIPTLPVAHGGALTVYQIAVWCLCYLAIATLAPLFLDVSWIYLSVVTVMGTKVIFELVRFSRTEIPLIESRFWLRFFLWINISLVVFLAAMVIDRFSVYLWVLLKT